MGKILVLPKLGQKGSKCNFWPYYPNARLLLVKIWQDLLENDFKYNDKRFWEWQNVYWAQFRPKRGKSVHKCNFWPYYPNALFRLVGSWQDILGDDFEDNDQNFGCGKNFIGPNLGQKQAKRV